MQVSGPTHECRLTCAEPLTSLFGDQMLWLCWLGPSFGVHHVATVPCARVCTIDRLTCHLFSIVNVAVVECFDLQHKGCESLGLEKI